MQALGRVGGVGPLVIVEGDPLANPGLRLRAGLPSVQIDALILQGPPEPFDEDVVEAAPLSLRMRARAAAMERWVFQVPVPPIRTTLRWSQEGSKGSPGQGTRGTLIMPRV